ncbi:periphilin-1 isoform X1 [Eublepharis macularius]|uniref:Periphilin-1 isoform X1 n=2 Tax=Eublepharis macularius TaxID=481883 RepID=A0AA97JVU3_EUBMA|nr:periphilin-1 isoform X1 [Eublepharis macularius]XP_054844045.1 periphilin-1 isoform X1 [Eublepharis macularius]XP_054844046.1 periphilin-1 isoform X1 [Eublepharis macularius]XP_054844047.1 periphilin-1 isoform X1 [Eublepharis macularius]
MAYRRDEMWSDERYEYERLPRERLPPRPDGMPFTFGSIKHQDDYPRVVSFGPKKPPLLERPGEGSYRYEYSHAHVGYREYEEGRGFIHERRSGPPHRSDDPGYRWPRDDHPASRQPDYRDIRDGTRRKNIYPHYARDRSPHKRDSSYFRESPVSRRDSPHSRSGSSVSSRSYSPDRSKAYAFHQSQRGRSVSSLHKRNISQGKERTSSQTLKTSRDVSPSGTTAAAPSKALDKSSRLSEKELAEAASRWAAEKGEKADTSNLPEISEYDAGSSEPLYVEQHEETTANITDSNELFEDSQHVSRSKAIAAKTKEIEQVYRQDCETFGIVVKMLIDKDPSLEKPIQFSLRQNLHEIGERCVEELKHFIADYDSASQEFEEP